jgi:hydrogenase maturation protein HypF
VKFHLPRPLAQPTLALGGDLKCRPVWAEGDTVRVLDEIGDLASPEKQDELEALVEELAPRALVCDKHPGYFATALAERVAAERGLALRHVQHHRAHVAAVCVEHALWDEPVVGLAFDGTGYGDDGVAWGGEFFTGSLAVGFERRAHFAPLPLPGGDAAVRAPWRIALALLLERGASDDEIDRWIAQRGIPTGDLELFRRGLRAGLAVGRSTSVGRWFDAVAALLGVRAIVAFEAQGAIELQKLAEVNAYDDASADWPSTTIAGEPALLDFPAIREAALATPEQTPRLAYAFHEATAEVTARTAIRLAETTQAATVILSGGVFFNRLLTNSIEQRLVGAGLCVRRSEKLSPGDNALALGQIGLALAPNETATRG